VARPDTALVARARGVATHLLRRTVLESLADATDVAAFARGLARLGTAVEPLADAQDLEAIEHAIRQTLGRHLRTLGRWPQRTPGVLDIARADFDRRSLRALIRGAAAAAPAAARLRGLIPTPRLPERVLIALSRQPSPRAVVGQLTLLGDTAAPVLAPLVAPTQPELLAIDAALLSMWARRAVGIAAGEDATVRRFVQRRVDAGNVQTALLLAGGDIGDPSPFFVEGGDGLRVAGFAVAAGARSALDAMEQLRRSCATSWLAPVLAASTPEVASVERAVLGRLRAELHREARQRPMGNAALLGSLLAMEAQAHDLRVLAWGAAMGAPAGMRRAQLVTP